MRGSAPLFLVLVVLAAAGPACKKEKDDAPAAGGVGGNGWVFNDHGLAMVLVAKTPDEVMRYGAVGDGLSTPVVHIQRSTNDAAMWSDWILVGPAVEPYGFFSLHFPTNTIGFADGWNTWWRSEDGGHTWNNAGTSRGSVVGRTDGARFFAFGNAQTYVSSDQGSSWTPITSGGPGDDLNAMEFVDDDTVRACGPQGISGSTDGGATWQTLLNGEFQSMSHRDADHGAAISMVAGITQVERTADAWATHSTVTMSAEIGLPAAFLYDGSGNIYASKDERLYRSSDQGATWELELECPADENVRQLFRSGNYLILVTTERLARKQLPL